MSWRCSVAIDYSDDPEFGEAAVDIPNRNPDGTSLIFWTKVAAYLKSSPELWHPLVGVPLAYATQRNLASQLRSRKTMSRIPRPLREQGFEARMVDKILYLRYCTGLWK